MSQDPPQEFWRQEALNHWRDAQRLASVRSVKTQIKLLRQVLRQAGKSVADLGLTEEQVAEMDR